MESRVGSINLAAAGEGMRRRLNALGLILGMIGVVIIFSWGWPQPSFEGESLTPDTSAEYKAELKAQKEGYVLMSQIGLGFVFVGFGLQLIAVWPLSKS
jgi:hypothetical protein